MKVSAILWDFGDTLCDERWMLRPPGGTPQWPQVWRQVMEDRAEDWNDGSIELDAIVDDLARRTELSVAAVEAHMTRCCERIDFFPTAWAVARQRRRPQALVTVNPSDFERLVVAPHRLVEVFDAIVVSGVEGTVDKSALCEIALARIGYDGAHSATLLIDNRDENVASWRSCGGRAYLFRDDRQFANDIDVLVLSDRGGDQTGTIARREPEVGFEPTT